MTSLMATIRIGFFWLCVAYVTIVVVAFAVSFALPHAVDPDAPGCYWIGLVGPTVKCLQFPGHEVVLQVLNFPRLLLYFPALGVGFVGYAPLLSLMLLGATAVLWASFVYLLWRLVPAYR